MCFFYFFFAFDRNNNAEPRATTLSYTVIFNASAHLMEISHKLQREQKAQDKAESDKRAKRANNDTPSASRAR